VQYVDVVIAAGSPAVCVLLPFAAVTLCCLIMVATQVRAKYGDDWERIGRMSIIEDGAHGDK